MNFVRKLKYLFFTGTLLTFVVLSTSCNIDKPDAQAKTSDRTVNKTASANVAPVRQPIDTARYDSLMRYLANGDTTGKWPVKNAPYPLAGALLPFNRIVAYYGNLYSKKM